MASILAYWQSQALGHPIRLLLGYVGEEFENKYYTLGPAPEYSTAEWINDKVNLGLDFPNLPYYFDGKVKLSQSNTILRYIARKYNMAGSTDEEKTRVDLALDQLLDNRWAMVLVCNHKAFGIGGEFEKLREDFVKLIPDKLKLYDNFLGNRPFIAGDNVTVADFPMYAMLKENPLLLPDCLNDFPRLEAFVERFENLPQIKKYKESPSYPKLNLYWKKGSYATDIGY